MTTRDSPSTARLLLVPATIGLAFAIVPIIAMATQVEWNHLPQVVTSDASQAALWLSLKTSGAATLLSVLFGLPLALWMTRSSARIVPWLRTAVLVPMVLPPVVAGIALLATFGRRGLVGRYLDVVGIDVPFTTMAVVLAQTFVAMPFFVMSVEGALRAQGDRYEQVAATLGAGPWTRLVRVTLPMIWPAMRAGLVLTFARALGEFGATITFAGSLQGVTRTLPLEVYLQREDNQSAAIALSLLLVLVATVTTLLTADRGRR